MISLSSGHILSMKDEVSFYSDVSNPLKIWKDLRKETLSDKMYLLLATCNACSYVSLCYENGASEPFFKG